MKHGDDNFCRTKTDRLTQEIGSPFVALTLMALAMCTAATFPKIMHDIVLTRSEEPRTSIPMAVTPCRKRDSAKSVSAIEQVLAGADSTCYDNDAPKPLMLSDTMARPCSPISGRPPPSPLIMPWVPPMLAEQDHLKLRPESASTLSRQSSVLQPAARYQTALPGRPWQPRRHQSAAAAAEM